MAKESRKPDAIANTAGVGGGTTLLGLAQQLPDDIGFWKQFAIMAAPAATLAIAAIWVVVGRSLVGLVRWIHLSLALREARRINAKVQADQNATAAHKRKTRQNLERLEQVRMEALSDETNSIRTALTESK